MARLTFAPEPPFVRFILFVAGRANLGDPAVIIAAAMTLGAADLGVRSGQGIIGEAMVEAPPVETDQGKAAPFMVAMAALAGSRPRWREFPVKPPFPGNVGTDRLVAREAA